MCLFKGEGKTIRCFSNFIFIVMVRDLENLAKMLYADTVSPKIFIACSRDSYPSFNRSCLADMEGIS